MGYRFPIYRYIKVSNFDIPMYQSIEFRYTDLPTWCPNIELRCSEASIYRTSMFRYIDISNFRYIDISKSRARGGGGGGALACSEQWWRLDAMVGSSVGDRIETFDISNYNKSYRFFRYIELRLRTTTGGGPRLLRTMVGNERHIASKKTIHRNIVLPYAVFKFPICQYAALRYISVSKSFDTSNSHKSVQVKQPVTRTVLRTHSVLGVLHYSA